MKDGVEMVFKHREKGVPTFIITAQDKYAIIAMNAYIRAMRSDEEVTEEYAQEIEQIHDEFEKWRAENKKQIKVPD